ncbi:MAG: DUF3141 domain-containing protein [Pseudomonadota bacterium]
MAEQTHEVPETHLTGLKQFAGSSVFSPDMRPQMAAASGAILSTQAELMTKAFALQMTKITGSHGPRLRQTLKSLNVAMKGLQTAMSDDTLAQAFQDYVIDAGQRTVLTLDTLRRRGDIFIEHEAAGCPPVLIYDHEMICDGKDMSRPCNYYLLRIVPPDGTTVLDHKRPYIIIDPRAGHGAGIGGFKTDSQVGVTLRDGHPVYFVGFRRMPEPGQTLADIAHAEAAFVREVIRRHPGAPRPVVTGNCQGGWATLLMAATNPDLTGPILLNGAPVDPWAGRVGENPMRYNGGVMGGAIHPMFQADLGNGVFDGANIVANFEQLNPSRNYFGKYYDLYARVDSEQERFLDFERWWGGFFLLNEAEMRWIVQQLFVGNRLVKNEAQLEPGRNIDVTNIRAPIIVFASYGDNITPPQQALNWIIKSYTDEREIEIRGQRIIYMLHDQVGHLGIFVSSKIARKEHSEVTSTLKTIETLPPGLFEMKIEDYEGPVEDRTFTVSFHARTMNNLRDINDGTDDEDAFAGVARLSDQMAETYDVTLRPLVQAAVTEDMAEMTRKLHPSRLQRSVMSTSNPMVAPIEMLAKQVTERRAVADPANPFLKLQQVWADGVIQSMDLYRDLRDMMYEQTFFGLWASPWARWYGRTNLPDRTLKRAEDLRGLPEVQSALMRIEQGGFAEAVIRMLILLADSRGSVRRDRLERSSHVLNMDEPFKSLSPDDRARILYEQKLIAEFEPDRAIESLPLLLVSASDRKLAAEVVQYVPGSIDEMAPHTFEMLQRFRQVLDLPKVTGDVTEDPLAPKRASPPVESVEE